MKSNIMRKSTWHYLALNYVEDKKELIEYKPYEYVSDINSKNSLECDFSDRAYGVNEEILKEVKEHANVEIFKEIETKDGGDFYYYTDKKNDSVISRFDILAKENSKASYLLSFDSKDSNRDYVNNLLRIKLLKNAKVKIIILVNLSKQGHNYQSISSIIGENASLEISYIDLGANKSLVNMKNFLDGKKSKLTLNGVYFKENDDYMDYLISNEHRGYKSKSDTNFDGALKHQAKKAWKGIVDLKEGCKYADGKISDYSMILSGDVVNKTAPVLLCREKEVKGNHAASIGKLDMKMLYYIMSRGLTKKQAESIILEAKFAPTIDKINNQQLREKLKDIVHRKNNGVL